MHCIVYVLHVFLILPTTTPHSNGLDLASVMASDEFRKELLALLNDLFLALFSISCPTLAIVTGHAFAAGFMLALAHDYRVMRSDKVAFGSMLRLF